jgi:hypothetical protein
MFMSVLGASTMAMVDIVNGLEAELRLQQHS